MRFSVIVPVYKVEDYLDQCVESIVNQTEKDLEVILVDDGSPDRCGEICDAWAKKDKRIKVIHKPNGGLSDASGTQGTVLRALPRFYSSFHFVCCKHREPSPVFPPSPSSIFTTI